MKEPIKVSPLQMVTDTKNVLDTFHKIHKELTSDIKDKNLFEAMIPEILTPSFIGLFGDSS